MTGPIKWPLGNHLSPRVVVLQGWSYVLVGASSLVLAVLLVVVPSVVIGPIPSVGWFVGVGLAFTVLLLICGVVPYVWSVVLSYRR